MMAQQMLDSFLLSSLLSGRAEQGKGAEWELGLSCPADTEYSCPGEVSDQ